MLNTLLDFAEPGVLGVFADADGIEAVDTMMGEQGYLDASAMAKTFDALRANDLIWNYVSSGWLMGEAPPAFDLLAWNADSTRMPARMHGEYLRTCYVENLLASGRMRMLGRRIELGKITADTYYVAAEQDHITPWMSCYDSSRLLGGDVRFILSSSGPHRRDRESPRRPPHVPHQRRAPGRCRDVARVGRRSHEGSWWDDWAAWMKPRAGRRGKPPAIGQRGVSGAVRRARGVRPGSAEPPKLLEVSRNAYYSTQSKRSKEPHHGHRHSVVPRALQDLPGPGPGLIEQSQKLAVESVSAWTKAVQPLAKNAPAAPIAGVPSPKEIVDNQYAFAAKLLEAQHEYFTAVLTAAAPVLPKTAPAAK